MRAGTDPMVVMLQNHQLLAPLTHADQQPSLSALNPHEISPLRGWVRGRTLSAGKEGGKLEAESAQEKLGAGWRSCGYWG